MKNLKLSKVHLLVVLIIFVVASFIIYMENKGVEKYERDPSGVTSKEIAKKVILPTLDVNLYNQKIEQLANNPVVFVATSSATSTPLKKFLWPVKTVYPNYGALLPFNRIVAYYGNFYSKKWGF